jgi:hypothetical protein
VFDQITVVAPNAATALREWRSAALAANAAEMKCLLEGVRSDTAASLRAAARELREVAWSLMRAEVERAAALTKTW